MISRFFFTTLLAYAALVTTAVPMDPPGVGGSDQAHPALVFQQLKGHEGYVSALTQCTFNGKTYVISGSEDWAVRVWDLASRQSIQHFKGQGSTIGALCCMKHEVRGYDDMLIISGGGRKSLGWEKPDPTLRIWSLTIGECLYVLEGHRDCVNDICVVGKNTIASCSDDGTIRLWDLQTMQCTKVFQKSQDAGPEREIFLSLALLDNQKLVCGYVNQVDTIGYVTILDLVSGEFERTFDIIQGSSYFLPIPASNRMVLLSEFDKRCIVVDWKTGQQKYSFNVDQKFTFRMGSYLENKIIFLNVEGAGCLYDYRSGQKLADINLGIRGPECFITVHDLCVYANNAFSRQGPLLCVAKDPFLI